MSIFVTFSLRNTSSGGRIAARITRSKTPSRLLLLRAFDLVHLLHDLPKHDHAIAVKESDAGETLAVLERVDHKRLLRGEVHLGHLVRLERVRVLHLLAARLLPDLPVHLRDAARRAPTADEANRGVANLDLTRDVEDLDLGIEVVARTKRRVLLVDHHVARPRHVLLVETLDVHADVVARARRVLALVVHLHREHLAAARVRGRVRREEADLLTRLHRALLHTSGNDVTDTLDLVDTRHRQTHGRVSRANRRAGHVVQAVVEAVDVELLNPALRLDLDVLAAPPLHVVRLLQEVVAAPPRDRQDRRALEHEILLPANLLKHVDHLRRDLVVAVLLVPGRVAVHLVHADDQLLHAQQVDEARVLAGLALDLAGLVVAALDRRHEVTVSRHHDERNVGLSRTGDHVLDEVTVTRGIDDGVVPLLGEELLRRARDGHTTLALLLLAVHEESERKRTLAKALGLLLQLLELTLRETAKLEKKPAGGRRLAAVDVAADDDREMLLLSHCNERGCRVRCCEPKLEP